jgi:hypothetical protein
MLLAALVAVMSYANVPASARVKIQAPERQSISVSNVDAPREVKTLAKAPAKAAEDYVIISEQPAGELKTYLRSGGCYVVQNQQVYQSEQSGTIDIVFGEDGRVYFKDIVSGLPFGTWVVGDLSADGNTITVAMGQNLYYHSTYDACIALTWVNYVEGTGFVADFDHESAEFVINADGSIALQGTALASASLGATWTDDQTFQNYGDFASVYSEYQPNLELVELPEGLTVEEKPITGLYYASVSEDGVDYSGTVKVARDGNTFYFQGLAADLPEAWVKGELADGIITVPITYLGVLNNQNVWSCGYSSSAPTEMEIYYLEDLNSFEFIGYFMLNPEELNLNVNALLGFYENLFIGERPQGITPPDGLATESLPVEGEFSNAGAYSGSALVGFDGDDVYIQGLFADVPEGWVKGQLNADHTKMTIPSGQYVGVSQQYGCSVYILGYDSETDAVAESVEFDFDEAKTCFTLVDIAFENASRPDEIYYIDYMNPGFRIGNDCDEIWIAAKQGYANAEDVSEFEIAEGINGTADKGEGSNGPKYYDSGAALRLYANNTLNISSEKLIGKIEFTFTGTAKQMLLEADKGSYALEGKVGTWLGKANDITFTVPAGSGNQARIVSIKIWYFDYATMPCTPPEDLVTEAYLFKAGGEKVAEVQVGFADGEYYFQGLSTKLPEAWVSGEYDAETGTVTIPNWFLGSWVNWFWTVNTAIAEEFVLTYDPQLEQFTGEGFTVSNLDADDGYDWGAEEYEDVVISKIHAVPAVPQAAEITDYYVSGSYGPEINFTIPMEDADGNELYESYMYYEFYTEVDGQVEPYVLKADNFEHLEEDMTRLAATYNDGYDIGVSSGEHYVWLNPDNMMPYWDRIGIKLIYTGGGEEHESEITWFAPVKEIAIELPEGVLPEMFQGETLQLFAVVDDNASETTISWSSSDRSIATVDKNGLVTALTPEEEAAALAHRAPTGADEAKVVTITATPRSNPSVSALIDITVKPTPSAINGVAIDKVVSVRYINAQGQVSTRPFDGFNIKVSKTSDGKTVTTKEIR